MAKTFYEFSADHALEEYNFNHGVMEVIEQERYPSGLGFCSSHSGLGVSKVYDTPEQAVKMLLLQHGCVDVIVHGEVSN